MVAVQIADAVLRGRTMAGLAEMVSIEVVADIWDADVVVTDDAECVEAGMVLLDDGDPGAALAAGASALGRDAGVKLLRIAIEACHHGLICHAPHIRAARNSQSHALARARPGLRGFDGSDDIDPPQLSPRESEVLHLIATGASNKSIARALGISVHTAKFHVTSIMTKLEASSRADAVARGMRTGLLLV